ncbi:MAG: ABC transporter substrate-binding protein [Acidimicrobiales bacterium]
MKMLSRKPLVAFAAALSLLLGACGSSGGSGATATTTHTSGPATLTSVTVAYVPLPLFEPLFVAMHDGYFTQRGIAVHLTVVGSGQSATTLAATNRVQVVLGGFSAGMFNAIHEGLAFTVVGSMAEEAPGTPANGLVVAKALDASGKVTTPAGLKGMKIAVAGGSGAAGAYLLAAALAPYHVDLSQVTLVNLSFPEMQSALQSGAVAAAYMSTPFLGAALSSGAGQLLVGAPVGTAVTGVIYGGTFARSKTAQAFFDALVEAAKQLQGSAANSPANLVIVSQATGEKMSLLQAEPPNVFSPNLAPPDATLTAMQKVFLANHDLNYTSLLPTSKYVNPTFSNRAG